MNPQARALVGLASLLDRLQLPYMIIGGMANAVWGEPRATLDIDATIWVSEPEMGAAIQRLAAALTAMVPDPVAFATQTRVLPLRDEAGVRIDVLFGLLPFEEEAIRRAVLVPIEGTPVRFCTAEDLILHKVVSERERDLEDARGVTLRRLGELDLTYLEPRITELARLLDRPEIQVRWQDWKRLARQRAPGGPGS